VFRFRHVHQIDIIRYIAKKAVVSIKVKVLAAALIADALSAAWIFMVDNQLLNWWLLANAAAVSAAVIAVLFRRSVKKRTGRASFVEHQEKHGSKHKTMKGELVKSGGERMIADYLLRNKISYEYEKPATGASNRRIGRPDFYLPDYDIYVEYWGMVDTEDEGDRKEYLKGMEWKTARYREAGIKFISIYPQEIENLDSVFAKKLKEATG